MSSEFDRTLGDITNDLEYAKPASSRFPTAFSLIISGRRTSRGLVGMPGNDISLPSGGEEARGRFLIEPEVLFDPPGLYLRKRQMGDANSIQGEVGNKLLGLNAKQGGEE